MRLTAIPLVLIASLSLVLAPGLAQTTAPKAKVSKLMDPAQLTEKAPEKYQVKFETTKGEFIVEVTRAWAPNGADRFYNLVKNGFYDGCGFYRVVKGFMVQFGVNGDPKTSNAWANATIPDDSAKQSNKRGYITFAQTGQPNSRTTQVFINYADRNSYLDPMNFPPFGKVIQGMDVVDLLYSGYGDMPSQGGKGPDPGQISRMGNSYLKGNFPDLDYIKTATIVPAAK